jgi:DNA-binding SARP family transcriptional activator
MNNTLLTQTISANHTSETTAVNTDYVKAMKKEQLISLLITLKQENQLLTISPRKTALDHAIQICQSALNNLLEIDWHKHLYKQARLQNKGLHEQLTLALTLLDLAELSQDLTDAMDGCDSASSDQLNKAVSDVQNHTDTLLKMYAPPHLDKSAQDKRASLKVYFFGTFRVYRDVKLIDCLSKTRAKQLLKYLLLNRTKAIPKEVLMDRFWPDHNQNSARNNLNVAVYCLRQTLKEEHSNFVHILFQNGCYFFNHDLEIHVDTEIFEQHIKEADRLMNQHKITEAIEKYKLAESIYQGEFLAEDLYEEWSLDLREYYKFLYIKLLGKLSEFYYREHALEDCIAVNQKITAIEIGDEEAHRRLMECFAQLNQRHLALRQYQLCENILAKEFDLKPSQETVALYRQIKAREFCSKDRVELQLKQA